MDDRSWITGDLYHSRNHDFEFKLRSFNGMQICMYKIYRRHGSTKYDTEYDSEHYSQHYSEHYSKIPNSAATCASYNAEYDPVSDPESRSYNGDTAQVVPD